MKAHLIWFLLLYRTGEEVVPQLHQHGIQKDAQVDDNESGDKHVLHSLKYM